MILNRLPSSYERRGRTEGIYRGSEKINRRKVSTHAEKVHGKASLALLVSALLIDHRCNPIFHPRVFIHTHTPLALSPSPRAQLTVQTLQNRVRYRALVDQILRQPSHDLNLLLRRQALDRLLDDATHTGLVYGNKTLVVHEGEKSHDELAVKPVCNASVAGNAFAKVLDLEGTLETRGEETAERGNEGGEGSKDEDVELHRGDGEGSVDVSPAREPV